MGDQVRTIADTSSGIHPNQAEAIYGTVTEVYFENIWMVKIKSIHDGRSPSLVPEARVRAISKSLADSAIVETRALPLQKRLAVSQSRVEKLKRKTSDLEASIAVVNQEVAALKTSNKKLRTRSDELIASNQLLAKEASEVSVNGLKLRNPSSVKMRRIQDDFRRAVEPLEEKLDAAMEFNVPLYISNLKTNDNLYNLYLQLCAYQ